MLQEHNVRIGFFEATSSRPSKAAAGRAPARGRVRLPQPVDRFRSEVLPLEWRHVDLKAGTVSLDPRQHWEQRRPHDLHDRAMRTLSEARKATTDALAKTQETITLRIPPQREADRALLQGVAVSLRRDWPSGEAAARFRRTAIQLRQGGDTERVATAMTAIRHGPCSIDTNIVSPTDLKAAAAKLDPAGPRESERTASVSRLKRRQR